MKKRRPFSKDEQTHYQGLKRGYQGECLFDQYAAEINGYLKNLPANYLVDLTLKHSRITQIDSLFVTDQTLYLFEIKNYSSDIDWDGELWQLDSGYKLNDDPIVQVSRSVSVIKNILQELNYDISVIQCGLYQPGCLC